MILKGWKVTFFDGDYTCWVVAADRGLARTVVYRSLDDAGWSEPKEAYKSRCVRAPEYDREVDDVRIGSDGRQLAGSIPITELLPEHRQRIEHEMRMSYDSY